MLKYLLIFCIFLSNNLFAETNTFEKWKQKWPNLVVWENSGTKILLPQNMEVVFLKSKSNNFQAEIFLGTERIFGLEEDSNVEVGESIWLRKGNSKQIKVGHLICILSNDQILSSMPYFSYHNAEVTKKFEFSNGQFFEVEQPYYKIDEKSSCGADIVIFNKIEGQTSSETIKKNEIVKIIGYKSINGDWFLLESESGVIGWHKLFRIDVQKQNSNKEKYSLSIFDGYKG